MKKHFSIVLAVMLILINVLFAVSAYAAPSDCLTVDGTSNYCASVASQTVNVGDNVVVEFTAPEDHGVTSCSWGVDYDKDKLMLSGISTFAPEEMIIKANGDMYDIEGSVTPASPYSLSTGDTFVTLVFTAMESGETTVDLKVIMDSEQSETLTVIGKSDYCPKVGPNIYSVGDSVVVEYIAPEDCEVSECVWGMNFDKDKLQLTGVSTFAPDEMKIDLNGMPYSVIGEVALSSPWSLKAGDEFVTFVFTALESGETSVDMHVIDLTVKENNSDKSVIKDGEDVRENTPAETVPETQAETAVSETKPAKETSPATADTVEPTDKKSDSPKTGEGSLLFIGIAIAAAALAVIGGSVIYKRVRSR